MNKKAYTILLLLTVAILIFPSPAGAAWGFEYATTLDLGTTDVRTTAVEVLNILLGFLGLVLLALICYAGFLWFTSKGDEEKVGKARQILTTALVGLLIILLSYAITRLVFGELSSSLGIREGAEESSSIICVDADSDGYDDVSCGGSDCDDSDASINPGATEVCDDTIDNNCDGWTDGDDPDCSTGPGVQSVGIDPKSASVSEEEYPDFTITVSLGSPSGLPFKDFFKLIFNPAQAQGESLVTAEVDCGYETDSIQLTYNELEDNYSEEWQSQAENCPTGECSCEVVITACEGSCASGQTIDRENLFEIAAYPEPFIEDEAYAPPAVPLGEPIEMTFRIVDVSEIASATAYIIGAEEVGIDLVHIEGDFWYGEWLPPTDLTVETDYDVELEAEDKLGFSSGRVESITLTVNPDLRTCEEQGIEDADSDDDGYAHPSCGGTDCDDADADEYPGVVWYLDEDGDSYYSDISFCERGSEPVAADDQDGDGFVDTSDNCSSIYNPTQSDFNQDGEGTACDNEIIFASFRDMEYLAGHEEEEGFETSAIYFTDLDSSAGEAVRFTEDKLYYNHFAVSPDHTKLAFNFVREDTNDEPGLDIRDHKELWVRDFASGDEWKISGDYNAGWGGIDWSLDSQYVYASMNSLGSRNEIYKVRISDGTIVKNITEGIEAELGPELGYSADGKWVSDAGVSPDETELVFLYLPMDSTGKKVDKAFIATIKIDGSDAQLLTDGGSHDPARLGNWPAGDFDPEFSPDGQSVVFQRSERDEGDNWGLVEGDIMVIKIDKTGLRRVTPAQTPGVADSTYGIPDWSEDNLILMSEWYEAAVMAESYKGLAVVNANGTNYRRIDSGFGSHSRWVPRSEEGEPAASSSWYTDHDKGPDCDDTDSSVHPLAAEICSDARDNDCDLKIDEQDTDCCEETWERGVCYTVNPYIMNGCHPDWSLALTSKGYPKGKFAFDKKNEKLFFDVCTVDSASTSPDADAICLTTDYTIAQDQYEERHYGGPTWHPDGEFMVIEMSKSWNEIQAEFPVGDGIYGFELPESCHEDPETCSGLWEEILPPDKGWDWIWSDFRYRTNPGQGLFNTLNYLSADGDYEKFERILWCPGESQLEKGPGPGESSENYPGVIHSHFSEDGRLFWSERIEHGADMCESVYELDYCAELKLDEEQGDAKWEAIEWGKWQLMVGKVNTDQYDYPCLENVEEYGPGLQPYFYETHAFSPIEGSDELLFSGNLELLQGAFYMDIYTYDPTEADSPTNPNNLTETMNQWDEHAHWSPSGEWITWMSSSGIDYSLSEGITTHIGQQFAWAGVLKTELWIMRARDPSKKWRLTSFNDSSHPHYQFFDTDQVIVSDMSWSPDGTELAISIGTGGGQNVMIIKFNEPM